MPQNRSFTIDAEETRGSRWRVLLAYVGAVAGTAVAFFLTQSLPQVFGRLPFAPYLIIGGILTLFGGSGPGLVMAALSYIATTRFADAPVGPWASVGAAFLALPTVWFIDRHQQTVRAVRTSERRYAHLCELSSDIVVTEDLDGRILSISDAGARLAGYPAASLIGRDSLAFLLPEDRERAREVRKRLVAARPGEMVSLEVGIVKADGSILMVDVRSGLATSGGRVVGFHTVARDVTARRQLELQLRHSQRLEAIGRLAGGVAHDFNNLLTAVRGFVDLAIDDLGASHSASSDLVEARRCCDRASDIVGQLLAFGRRQELSPVVVDVNGALGGIEPMIRRLVGGGVSLACNYGPNVGQIQADPHKLTQIVMNLAVNARDAMPDGGRLTVSTAEDVVKISRVRGGAILAPGRYVVISVTDTGQGIEAGALPHIFEPFFTTKPAGVGTGLGLATVYGIVKQSGGYIWVDSEVGRGTRFDVYFPGVTEPAPAGADGQESALLATP